MPIIINKNDNGYWTCDLYSNVLKSNSGPAWPLFRWPIFLGITQTEMLQIYIDFGAEEMKDFSLSYEPFNEPSESNRIIFMGFKNKEDAEHCKEWLDSCLTMIKIERTNKNGR